MSFDVSFRIDVGAGNEREVEDGGNITYNVSPMFYMAFGSMVDGGLRGLDGRNAGGMIDLLRIAVQRMEDHPDEYRALNPPNGWGNYEGALDFLRRLLVIAVECPNTTIRVY